GGEFPQIPFLAVPSYRRTWDCPGLRKPRNSLQRSGLNSYRPAIPIPRSNMRRLLLLALLPVFAFLALPANSAETPAPRTLMVTPGKLLFSDDLGGGVTKANGWNVAKGKFDAADGATRGAELKSDMHGGVARKALAFKDAVIEYS